MSLFVVLLSAGRIAFGSSCDLEIRVSYYEGLGVRMRQERLYERGNSEYIEQRIFVDKSNELREVLAHTKLGRIGVRPDDQTVVLESGAVLTPSESKPVIDELDARWKSAQHCRKLEKDKGGSGAAVKAH